MPRPTLIAYGGRPGRWYIDNPEYGPNIPVLHYRLYDLGGRPWPHQFLIGDAYDQLCGSNWEIKQQQIERMIELSGLVCMSYDTWERPPFTPGEGGRHRGGAGVGPREAVVAGGDREAGRHALYIPLPGARRGFVKIVDVEDDVAFRCGKSAEIDEMTVATRLHFQPGGWCSRQVGGHDPRRHTIEGEWRREHPPIPDRNELLHSADVRLAQ